MSHASRVMTALITMFDEEFLEVDDTVAVILPRRLFR